MFMNFSTINKVYMYVYTLILFHEVIELIAQSISVTITMKNVCVTALYVKFPCPWMFAIA